MDQGTRSIMYVSGVVDAEYDQLPTRTKGVRIASDLGVVTLTGNLPTYTLPSAGFRSVPATLQLKGGFPVTVPIYLEVAPAGAGAIRVGIRPPDRLPFGVSKGRYLTAALSVLGRLAPTSTRGSEPQPLVDTLAA
ncbi:MAG TPA: hypothetical protein VG205_10415 [Acidimicrobiales bacterium]|nr:hypothetical protein [Acidimicrobiales bacterium]